MDFDDPLFNTDAKPIGTETGTQREDSCLPFMTPPLSEEEGARRIANVATLEGLICYVFANMEQFRKSMNEAGWNTAYRMRRQSDNKISRMFVAEATGKDGSKWEFELWEIDGRSPRVIMTRQTKRGGEDNE